LDNVELKIGGLKELEKKLLNLGPELARKGLRSAVAAGAKVIKNAVLARAPEESGALKANVYAYRVRNLSNYSMQTYHVGVRGGVARYANTAKNRREGIAGKEYKADGETFYWKFHEFGTEKMAARPFIVPAFEETKYRAAEAIKAKLAERVETLARQK
jgi:HK97 gp10 family phage protein